MATHSKEVNVTYTTFKTVKGSLPSYYLEHTSEKFYDLISVSDVFVYICRLTNDTEITDFETTLKNQLTSVGSKKDAIALASIISKQNKVKPKSADGKEVVTVWPTEGSKVNYISPNWCDRTTWYYRAVRVIDEVATVKTALVYTVYKVSHTSIIDGYHGKLSYENILKDANGNSYRVIVKVDGVTKTEQDPHLGTGGDYTMDYAAGEITFLQALTADNQVKVTYHYENGSEWVLRPENGKILKIKTIEVQFSTDVVLTDSIVFQPYGPVEIWAPTMTPNPFPAGTMLPLGDPDVYKNMLDYINDSNGTYVTLPKMGGAGWRGMQEAVQVFRWDYQAVTDLNSSKGVEVRIYIEHNVPLGGWVATATFYCLAVPE
jgi:hypothetical protein